MVFVTPEAVRDALGPVGGMIGKSEGDIQMGEAVMVPDEYWGPVANPEKLLFGSLPVVGGVGRGAVLLTGAVTADLSKDPDRCESP